MGNISNGNHVNVSEIEQFPKSNVHGGRAYVIS